jgi:hypothetical protein
MGARKMRLAAFLGHQPAQTAHIGGVLPVAWESHGQTSKNEHKKRRCFEYNAIPSIAYRMMGRLTQ